MTPPCKSEFAENSKEPSLRYTLLSFGLLALVVAILLALGSIFQPPGAYPPDNELEPPQQTEPAE